MRHVVVAENLLLAVRLTHAFDHRVVVQGIRQNQAVRHQPGQRGNAGLVGDVAGGKDQRRFLAVQIGEFALELDQRVIGAGDVAGAAGAGAHPRRGLDHGANHFRVLTHAEVIVRAPDHHIARALRRMPDRMREAAGNALEIGKHPIAPLAPQPGESVGKIIIIVHGPRLPAIVAAFEQSPRCGCFSICALTRRIHLDLHLILPLRREIPAPRAFATRRRCDRLKCPSRRRGHNCLQDP